MSSITTSPYKDQEVVPLQPIFPQEPLRLSPQDVLIAFQYRNIDSSAALSALTALGIFEGDALEETLLTLLDGIRTQDTSAALGRFPPGFRNRVMFRVEQLVMEGEVEGDDGQLVLDLFQSAEQ